jgi:DNA helicase IV
VAVWQAEMARLDAAEQGLCFGRLDMHDGRRIYIGRLGLFRDEGGEPLLLDWRVPVARAFYTATAALRMACGDGGVSPRAAGRSLR